MLGLLRKNPVVVAQIPKGKLGEAGFPLDSSDDKTTDVKRLRAMVNEDARMADRDEIASMAINGNLVNVTVGGVWSSSVVEAGLAKNAWMQHFSGYRCLLEKTSFGGVWCVSK